MDYVEGWNQEKNQDLAEAFIPSKRIPLYFILTMIGKLSRFLKDDEARDFMTDHFHGNDTLLETISMYERVSDEIKERRSRGVFELDGDDVDGCVQGDIDTLSNNRLFFLRREVMTSLKQCEELKQFISDHMERIVRGKKKRKRAMDETDVKRLGLVFRRRDE
eukprot:TRINITY_DN554_c0_g1_i1.p1 TRINITY_DN554_c0_g1~~TRINITY_DN554_c0_g1_i1.p1  ORF type:complete len:163 (-),score=39.01 TRINITY_DN554_c0_g1_i1:30-518(-)